MPFPRLLLLFSIAALLAVEVWLHWHFLTPLENARLWTIGGWAEIILWCLLAMLLVAAQVWELPTRIRLALTAGFAVWLVGATADVADEVLIQPLWLSSWVEDIMRVSGMVVVAIALLALLRHSSRVMRELERLSLIDPLTGLSNRRSFRHAVSSRSVRGLSLILMDLDLFKNVNDRFGHDAGDEVLCKVGEMLKTMRPDQAEVFRLGGEEFAVLTEPMPDQQLLELADRIRIQTTVLNALPELTLTLSAGVGTLRSGEDHAHLMRRVDQALYSAKDHGRNRVILADPVATVTQ